MGKKTSKALVARGKRKLQQVTAFFRKLWRIKKVRIACFVLAGLILLAEVIPLAVRALQAANYDLGAVKNLVDPTSKDLRQKLTYDDKTGAWAFNANAADQLPGQSGDGIKVGGLTYSAELPRQMSSKSGLKMTDAEAKIDMTMTPQFGLAEGRMQEGYAVYPIKGSDAQLVYTFKQDGVKEDIILHRAPGDKTSFAYTLDLPDSLEARLQDDGSVGIFGGAKTLFGNISYGSDKDKELVEKARKNSRKTELYYALPAPVIKGGKDSSAKAKFKLDGKKLTVEVTGLKQAHYPLSIDPSFVMTAGAPCSWEVGNQGGYDGGNTDYSGCTLKRGAITGGKLSGNWQGQTSLPAGSDTSFAVATTGVYAGYIYTATTGANGVRYAKLGANGTIDASGWKNGPAFPAARTAPGGFIWNGYLYVVGGNGLNTTIYSKLNTDGNGAMGAWQTASATLAKTLTNLGAAAYNGYAYVAGGNQLASIGKDVYVAPILANGDLGAWVSTTDLPSESTEHIFEIHNGYAYTTVGLAGLGGADCRLVYYIPIKSNGQLDTTWKSATSIPAGSAPCRRGGSIIYKGYFYIAGGWHEGNTSPTSTVICAKIYADGSLGKWDTTSSLPVAVQQAGLVGYGNYLYSLGGNTNPTDQLAVNSAPIASPGDIGSFSTTTPVAIAPDDGIRAAASVVYGGRIYLLGGITTAGNSRSDGVYYATLSSDGSVGSWTLSGSHFTTGRAWPAAVAHNGYLYVIGGSVLSGGGNCTTVYCADIQKSAIAADGSLGAWSSAGGSFTGASEGRRSHGAAVYGGYLYIVGGENSSGVSAQVDIAQIDPSTGNVGAWSNYSTAMGAYQRTEFGLAQMGKYLYVVGGESDSANTLTKTVLVATLSSSGTVPTFTDTATDFTGSRSGSIAQIYNNYLYIIGGRTSTGNGAAGSNDVQHVKLDPSSGALVGPWSTSASTFTTTRVTGVTAMHNGYIYMIGGCSSLDLVGGCGTAANNLEDVQYAQVYSGGGGSVAGWTTTGTTSLPVARRGHGTVVYNGYLYVLGGIDGNNSWTGTVYYSPITSSGNGAWATTNSWLDVPGISAGFLAYNGYMYKLGGDSNSGSAAQLNDVQYAPINSDGSLGAWKYTWNNTSGTTQGGAMMTTGRRSFGATVYNGRLYVSGGCINQPFLGNCTITGTIETAAVNTDGTVGNWSTIGTNLPSSRWYHRMVTYNGYIYVIAGCEGATNLCTNRTTRVDYARANGGGLDADAGCGAMWCRTADIPTALSHFSAYAYSGYLYILGGERANDTPTQVVSYAPIYANGMLGSWSTSAEPLPAGRTQLGVGGTYNGKFYVVAGCGQDTCNLGSATSTVYQAGPQSTPQLARHSMLLTTDARTLPANFFSTISPQGVNSAIKVTPWTTNDSGGSPANVTLTGLGERSGMTTGVKYPLTPGNDGTKYYWLQFVLDDTQTYTWGETASPSTFSYFQLNYHPNPGKRLRGGKTFNQNAQQSLDAR